jgi:hypothetical protein
LLEAFTSRDNLVRFGGANGENAIAVIGEGVQSTKRQRCTVKTVPPSVVGAIAISEKLNGRCRLILSHSQKMSLFGIGGGAPGPPQGNINPQQMDIAIAELDMITDVFNRLVS